MLVLLAAATISFHLLLPGPVPSGADGGNWLALAKELRGMEVMSAKTSYPPLFPGLLAGLLLWLGSVPALVVGALLAKVCLTLALYMVARPLSPMIAAGAAVVGLTAGAQGEAYAWGAYPQLLATAFGLLASYLLARNLEREQARDGRLALILALLVPSTHLLIGGLLPLVLGLVAVHSMLGVGRDSARGRLRRALVVIFPSAALFLLFWWMSSRLGVEPVINPLMTERLEALRSLIREAPVPWIIILGLALASAGWPYWPGSARPTVSTGLACSLAGFAFFAATGEPRSLLLTQLGLVVLATAPVAAVGRRIGSHHVSQPHRLLRKGAAGVALPSMLAAIAVSGSLAYVEATHWYRVVDQDELAGLALLRDASDDDSLVLASRGHHGNPIGWWVEGYAERQTYTAVRVSALAFAEERRQAETANAFFVKPLDDEEVRALLDELGADFVVVDRRGPDAGWLAGEGARSLPVLYESETLVILCRERGGHCPVAPLSG